MQMKSGLCPFEMDVCDWYGRQWMRQRLTLSLMKCAQYFAHCPDKELVGWHLLILVRVLRLTLRIALMLLDVTLRGGIAECRPNRLLWEASLSYGTQPQCDD